MPIGSADIFAQMEKALQLRLQEARDEGLRTGIKMAAEIADTYNSSTTHPYRLGDCIMAKLNQIKRKPRRNLQRIKKFTGPRTEREMREMLENLKH